VSEGRGSGGGPDLVIVHLYPDLLMSYGDRGNVLTLARRAEWRGFDVSVVGITRGEPLPSPADLVMIGGGSDRVQLLIGDDIGGRGEALAEVIAAGGVVLGVCGGYQLLGHRYAAVGGGEVDGLGLLDVATEAGNDRIIGRVRASARLSDRPFPLAGFENHAGRTRLGADAAALATVPRGQGNNGEDGTEGAVQGRVIGTYLHGPVLPSAPAFADTLLGWALERATGGAPLAELDDRLELEARRVAETLPR
jgi:CobQ-like glutamine amidotransferase family enzyme